MTTQMRILLFLTYIQILLYFIFKSIVSFKKTNYMCKNKYFLHLHESSNIYLGFFKYT